VSVCLSARISRDLVPHAIFAGLRQNEWVVVTVAANEKW
jgi:hypothetical protein